MPLQDGVHQMDTSPEQRFLNYARSGNKSIIQALIQEYADRSYSQARRIIGRDDGAEDAVQNAYLRLVTTASRYDGSVPFSAWIGRLVNAAAIDYRRQLHRRRNSTEAEVQKGMAMNEEETGTPDSAELEALRTALDSLPDHYRTPLTLHYFGGLNRDETAQALGISTVTIAKQIERGLQKLRGKLGRAGFAVTSAGLLAVMASLPSYAATPEFKATLTSTERLMAASRQISERLLKTGPASAAGGFGIIKVGVLCALAVSAAVILSLPRPVAPVTASLSPTSVQVIGQSAEPGLIAHWKFDDTNGLTARDSSGNGNDGVLFNGPTWISSRSGGALSFDGKDDYVSVPDSPSLNSIADQMTVTAWIMRRSDAPDYGSIIGRRMGEGWDDAWNLSYKMDPGKNYFFLVNVLDGETQVIGPSSVSDVNKWVHLAGVYQNGKLRIYRNGSPASSADCAGAIVRDHNQIVIGACDAGDNNGITEFIDAAVDEIRLYNRALSDAEIAVLAKPTDQ